MSDFRRVPCGRCGAKTVNQAENMCKPTDYSGESNCPGMYMEVKNGWLGCYRGVRSGENFEEQQRKRNAETYVRNGLNASGGRK